MLFGPPCPTARWISVPVQRTWVSLPPVSPCCHLSSRSRWARMIDRHREMPFVVGGLAFVCAVGFMLTVVDAIWALVVTQAFLGLGQVLTVLGLQALIANSDARQRDSRFAAFTVVVSLGQFVGPAAAGFLSQHAQLSGGGGLPPGGLVGRHRCFPGSRVSGARRLSSRSIRQEAWFPTRAERHRRARRTGPYCAASGRSLPSPTPPTRCSPASPFYLE